jgi:FkbM family methyltransferase
VFEFLLQNPRWSVALVEPLPDIFVTLKRNYAAHRNDITFLNCAVAEKPGYRDFYVCGRDGKRSSLLKEVAEGHDPRVIPVPTLDYKFLCRLLGWDHVDFVKMDCEGYDEIIVQSILACDEPLLVPSALYWERGRHSTLQCEQTLAENGFRVFRSGLTRNGGYMDRLAMRPGVMSIPERPAAPQPAPVSKVRRAAREIARRWPWSRPLFRLLLKAAAPFRRGRR